MAYLTPLADTDIDGPYMQEDHLNKLNNFFRTQKENMKQTDAIEEQRMLRTQREYLDVEIRKFKRKKLLNLHNLEQELLREVIS